MAILDFDSLPDAKKPETLDFNSLPDAKKRTWAGYAGDVAENVPRRFLQGATFGFGEELSSGLAAVPALFNDKNYSDEYAKNLAFQRAKIQEAKQENPYIGGAAELGGAIGPGIAAIPKSVLGWAGSGGRLARSLKGAAVGAPVAGASGAIYGYGTGEGGAEQRLDDAASMGTTSAIAGAALPLGIGAVGAGVPYVAKKALDAVSPSIDEGLVATGKLAQKYNIPLSFSSLTKSEPVKNFQKMSQAIPFSGEAQFRGKQMDAFNRALTKSFGYESHKITPEVMNAAFKKVGSEFDQLGKGKTFPVSGFQQSLDDILADSAIYTEDAIAAFKKEAENIASNFTPDGLVSGERLSQLRTRLNRFARKTNDQDKAELFKSLENSVIDLMTAGDDVAKSALSEAKRKYKNLLVVEPLANKAVGGEINPSLLANRAEKIYGRAYTTGNAGEIGDLARIGKELLVKEGGSDTAPKLVQAGLGGTALTALANPAVGVPAASIAAAGVAGNRAIQSSILRNQYLVNRALNKSSDLLKILENGGNISREAIDALPVAERNSFLSRVMKLPAAQAKKILNRQNNVKE